MICVFRWRKISMSSFQCFQHPHTSVFANFTFVSVRRCLFEWQLRPKRTGQINQISQRSWLLISGSCSIWRVFPDNLSLYLGSLLQLKNFSDTLSGVVNPIESFPQTTSQQKHQKRFRTRCLVLLIHLIHFLRHSVTKNTKKGNGSNWTVFTHKLFDLFI